TAGQYQNTGTATGTSPTGGTVTDSDPSHYFGSNPSIDIEKATNGEDADSDPGPFIPVGSTVTWTYLVTNNGNVPLTNVSVSDDQSVCFSCPNRALAVRHSFPTRRSSDPTAGQYQNTGTATGTPPTGGTVTDSDDSHYFGSNPA